MAVVPYELNIYRMQPLIARGDIDFGFMTLFPDQETQDAYETLFEEEILLAVPAFLEVAGILKPKESVYPRLPLSELADYPFYPSTKGNNHASLYRRRLPGKRNCAPCPI